MGSANGGELPAFSRMRLTASAPRPTPEPPSFSGDEFGRYSRQLMLGEVGFEGQAKLRAARVCLIGAGGLGTPAAMYLAAAGVGTIGLVDFDTVDYSNLQRQILFDEQDVADELPKAIAAAGADVVMLGSPLARAEEAPGRGTNWGMAAPSPTLPRGTRIGVGTVGTLERILFGPARVTDGSENLIGALRQSMAALGARTIREMQAVEMVYAPSVATEGKSWQRGG